MVRMLTLVVGDPTSVGCDDMLEDNPLCAGLDVLVKTCDHRLWVWNTAETVDSDDS